MALGCALGQIAPLRRRSFSQKQTGAGSYDPTPAKTNLGKTGLVFDLGPDPAFYGDQKAEKHEQEDHHRDPHLFALL